MSNRPRARAVAMYLPQFHPIPENDAWWGPGFTEWTNVAKARPLFRGHRQPRLPGALGFYDLRLPETRVAQADLARAAGIEGFAYWHYWFGDSKVLLERPFRDVLDCGSPDFGFCLAWANQTWTGIWHGAPDRTLVEQQYPGAEDLDAHFAQVVEAFRDPRYLRVDGKPIFYVQAPATIPPELRFAERWRDRAEQANLVGLYLVGEAPRGIAPDELGFDAWVRPVSEFLPHRLKPRGRIARRLTRGPRRGSFAATADAYDQRVRPSHHEHPTILTGWDNTPRSGRRGVVLTDETERAFEGHVRRVVEEIQDEPAEARLVFVKSWNEWAEGNYLEPDWEDGDMRLKVLERQLRSRT